MNPHAVTRFEPQPLREFFTRLFGDEVSPERQLVICWKKHGGQKFNHSRQDSIEQAVKSVGLLANQADVWFGNSLVTGLEREQSGRGSREHTCCVGALWVDLDIKSPAHAREELPVASQARQLLETLPLEPTLLVHSGYGFHAYWHLECPRVFLTPEERDMLERHTRGWHGYVGRAAAAQGWKVENVGDLPRILRVPGTWNFKLEPPRPCCVVSDPGGCYLLEDFTPFLSVPAGSGDRTEPIRPQAPLVCPLPLAPVDNVDRSATTVNAVHGETNVTSRQAELKTAAEQYLQTAPAVPEGLRNTSAFNLAGRLAEFCCAETGEKLSPELVLELLRQWNARNQPPLGEDELRAAVSNAGRYNTRRIPRPIPPGETPSPAGTAGDWPELLPWDAPPPAFPLETLPAVLRDWCAAEAEATQTPAALPGLLTLAACSAALAGKIRVQVTPDWQEPVNLYTVVVLDPGNRKSAVFRHVQQPLEEWERRENDRRESRVQNEQLEKTILEKRLARLMDAAAKAEEADQRATLLADAAGVREELAGRTWLDYLRLFADNVTNEKLGVLLAQQQERIAVFSPEGNVFQILAGLYSRRAEFEIYLKAHAGDAMRIDRLNREPIYLERPALTLGLTVQEDILRGLAHNSAFRGQGLLARFLFAVPESRLGEREVDPAPMPADLQHAYRDCLWGLCDGPPRVLTLTPAASALLKAFAAELEPALREDGGSHDIQDWAAKLAGAVVRIAALLQLAHDVTAPEIQADWLQQALHLGRFLQAHARVAFDLIQARGGLSDARYLHRRLREKGMTSFTRRDAQRLNPRRFRLVADLQTALDELILRGYLRELPREYHTTQPLYQLRPEEARTEPTAPEARAA